MVTCDPYLESRFEGTAALRMKNREEESSTMPHWAFDLSTRARRLFRPHDSRKILGARRAFAMFVLWILTSIPSRRGAIQMMMA
jgi:hypothetical protein